jgi:hypothetical protein
MKKIVFGILALLMFWVRVQGQDMGWVIEQTPMVSAILNRVLDKAAPFTAKIILQVAGKAEATASTAMGTLEFKDGNMRCEAKLGEISSAQLTSNARSLVRQINGDIFILLTRADQKTNYLVLPGAQACLVMPLPSLKLSATESFGEENIDGHACLKDKMLVTTPLGATDEVFVWRAKDLKSFPIQVQIVDSGEVFRIVLRDAQTKPALAERFHVPVGLTRYTTIEDLLQSILLDRMKRRMGLE